MEANFDAIIIGGSYAGLSAAMALGRALRKVLVLDAGKPANRQTPHAHNFITHDGETPAAISAKAKEQVLEYPTITFKTGTAINALQQDGLFIIETDGEETYTGRKLLFATGIVDVMPDIAGTAECWGISVLHCPYCHGYEVRNRPTAILANGDIGFEFSKIITNWTQEITLLTNGPSTLKEEQIAELEKHNITINPKPIKSISHEDGYMNNICFEDGSNLKLTVMYAKLPFIQTCPLLQTLGCEFTDAGFIKIDEMQATTVKGVYAAGDNTTMMRSVPSAVAQGNKAGAMINHQLVNEDF
ncbi:NAD(P)/FAD-dependent oxidoreductase [Mucilaginibacter pedocola]|uniref:Pyridine nucleotide-disulfide oxidoreductase n=1 Tax=Mucilaginibacter pedocola TaxID=1792845 RepID=A0A1S9PFM1_9SPHI|nr:NAD(P)/FAD-dependent oxidoreductase [Mucilaginibacter pedocola]OOQ59717.1 pyridine nucleotide-disulfide oxidoreductase [Mucilaginibacter pedocola]